MAQLTKADLAAQKKINALDLATIVKVTRKEEKWTPTEAADAERWYKNFLFMCYLNRRRPVAALGRDADRIWHNHILDTVRYQRDCQKIFGRYLNHQTIPGKRTRAHKKAIKETTVLAMQIFNDKPPDAIIPCWFVWW